MSDLDTGARPDQLPSSGNKRRVCMLIHHFYPHVGGAETNLKALIEPLRTRGFEVAVVTRGLPGLPARDTVAGAPVIRLSTRGGRTLASVVYTLQALRWIARRRRAIDLIHAHHLLSPTTTGVLAKLLFGIPLVVTVLRGGPLGDVATLGSGLLGRIRQRWFTRVVDVFVAVSDEIEQDLRASGVPRDRIVHIPYGVDPLRFRPAGADERAVRRQELGLDGHRVVVSVGRLVAQKGLDWLLDAWSSVRQAVPDALLVLAGDGPERAALEARRAAGVRFLGTTMDPVPLLQAADCFVQPSSSEGLSNALLEALASGLPVVATAIGGTVDAVRDGVEGLLVPPRDAEALAQALIRALEGPERRQLGAAARARILERYSIAGNADRLREVYVRLLQAGGTP